jgi:hypothetical protein
VAEHLVVDQLAVLEVEERLALRARDLAPEPRILRLDPPDLLGWASASSRKQEPLVRARG